MRTIESWRNHLQVSPRLLVLMGIATAVLIQVLVTPSLGGVPIRIAIADLLVPLFALLSLAALWTGQLRRPNWGIPNIDIMMLAVLIWFAISCVVGLQTTGQFIVWAWGTKLVGLIVLIIYLAAGVLIATAGDAARKATVQTFVITAWFVAVLSLLRFSMELNGINFFDREELRPVGLSQNPNAFAFLLGTAVLLQSMATNLNPRVPPLIASFGLALLLSALFLTGSRSAYLGLLTAAPLMLFFRKYVAWKSLLAALLIALAIVSLVSQKFELVDDIALSGRLENSSDSTVIPDNNPLDYATRNPIIVDSSIRQRVETSLLALDLWSTSPLVGIGMGGFMHHYQQVANGTVFTIHTSALWLLVETGIVGLTLFLSLFASLFWGLFRRAKPDGDVYAIAMCVILVFAAGVSIGTEIIYQRHLWLLVGLAVFADKAKFESTGKTRQIA